MTGLWLRADASSELGLGHVMRMVALGQSARLRGLNPYFVMRHDPVSSDLPARFGFPSLGLDRWSSQDLSGHVVVFDGYQFGPGDHLRASERGAVVAAMDDFGTGRFEVDLLVNQNLPSTLDVALPAAATVLVGPRYALIRDEFRKHRQQRDGSGSRLLVTLGGTDTEGNTGRVLDAAFGVGFDEIVLLVGRSGAEGIRPDVQVVHDPPSVGEVFASVDAAISAAGSTTWELLCCGVPTALIQTEDNQRHIARPVAERGAGLYLGDHKTLDSDVLHQLAKPGVRQRLSSEALRLVDGRGAERVVDTIVDLLETS